MDDAIGQEKLYDWLGAAETYEKVLGRILEKDFERIGEVLELKAYALYRAAFQSDSAAEFRDCLGRAVEHYKKAEGSYSSAADLGTSAFAGRCGAMIALCGFWAAGEVSERKARLEEAWGLAKESLGKSDSIRDSRGYGRTYSTMVLAAALLECYDDEMSRREGIVREALTLGERATRLLEGADDPEVVAAVYTAVAYFLQALADDYADPAGKEKHSLKAQALFSKARSCSEASALVSSVYLHQMHSYPDTVSVSDSVAIAENALERVRPTRDNYLIGRALENLARLLSWQLASIEVPEERRTVGEKVLELLLESQRRFNAIDFLSSCICGIWGAEPYGSYFWWMCEKGSEVDERRELAERAMERSDNYLDLARKSGFKDNWLCANYIVGSILLEMGRAEDDLVRRKDLLTRACGHLDTILSGDHDLHPHNYWFKGIDYGRLALAESDLALMAEDPVERGVLFKKALGTRLQALDYYRRTSEGPRGESEIFMTEFAEYLYDHGAWCHQIYLQTKEREYLDSSLETLAGSAKWYAKVGTPSRCAEAHWRLAEILDGQEEYLRAARSFSASAEMYMSAADRVRSLREFYTDYGSYLHAWSEIEQAAYHHSMQEPEKALECYRRAAELHESTMRWRYLSRNYLALSELENAENLSRHDESGSAAKAFAAARDLFRESSESIQKEMPSMDDLEMRQMATRLVKAASLRIEYCGSRQTLEEGAILYKKGEAGASSEKYRLAAESFERMLPQLESDRDRKDIGRAALLSKAWGMLARAEVGSSPDLYQEASRLFESVRDLCEGEKEKSLVIGHSRFCKALEAGTRFSETGDPDLHGSASMDLDVAAKYYLKAGANAASDHARASKLLFDAYAHMNDAVKEKDHEKKARLYTAAEKVLKASAESFAKANQLGKETQVLMLLDKAREERELALSLNEVLRAPDIVSRTMMLSPPTPSQETAVGLARFEHADIQATLAVRPRDVHVGEDFSLEIDLVNAGRGAAQLAKVEEVVPDGFDVTEVPERYRVEGSYLNMKGRRLDALKTEDVRIRLRPRNQGRFSLRPRISYMDEEGNRRSFQPGSVEITVRELGIAGWLRGPERGK